MITGITEKLIEKIIKSDIVPTIPKSEFDQFFEKKFLKKDEVLLNFNSVCRHYYFVNKGALKVFFVDEGKEYTGWLAFEGYFFTETESYSTGSFSQYCIVAMENSEILKISKSNMEFLLKNHPFWQRFVTITHEETIIKLMRVLRQFQTKKAADRYEDLFNYPDYLQRAKQKDISTLIGITKHSLSRIRKTK